MRLRSRPTAKLSHQPAAKRSCGPGTRPPAVRANQDLDTRDNTPNWPSRRPTALYSREVILIASFFAGTQSPATASEPLPKA